MAPEVADEADAKKISFLAARAEESKPEEDSDASACRASTNSSTVTGPSEASLSEAASSHGGGTPRHEADAKSSIRNADARGCMQAAWKAPLPLGRIIAGSVHGRTAAAAWLAEQDESPDSSPKRSRRRRNRGGQADQEKKGRAAFEQKLAEQCTRQKCHPSGAEDERARGRKQVAAQLCDLGLAASESPIRRGTSCPWNDGLAASSSPCRARVGPCGIMSTESALRQLNMASLGGGDASTRMLPLQPQRLSPTCVMPVRPLFPQQQPKHQLGSGDCHQTLLVSTPGSPCRPNRSDRVGIVSTSPYVATTRQVAALELSPAAAGGRARTTDPAVQTQTSMDNILKSMLGASSLRSGEDLAAQLLAAAPEIYEE